MKTSSSRTPFVHERLVTRASTVTTWPFLSC
ncbi:hypothetical protein SEA_CROZENNI_46 [Microbacterium phage CroZenni]|nr:hypothetical protein QDW45_gp46 [Microbacterium phage CroZenni]QWY79892.1 hypothetical protein SEA_CROZENNI_46 [Microbacterium phage CroZenni]